MMRVPSLACGLTSTNSRCAPRFTRHAQLAMSLRRKVVRMDTVACYAGSVQTATTLRVNTIAVRPAKRAIGSFPSSLLS